MTGFTDDQRAAVAAVLEKVAGTYEGPGPRTHLLAVWRIGDILGVELSDQAAHVVEIVAEDGLPEPFDLDVALDSIEASLEDRLSSL
jgi:hypothetical protein